MKPGSPILIHKYQTSLGGLARDKRSSLFFGSVSDGETAQCDIGTGAKVKKLFTAVIYECS